MTTQPCAAIRGLHSLETAEPADIRAKSTPRKSKFSRSRHFSRWSPNDTSTPIERREAMANTSSAGELPLGEDIEHLPADIAGGSNDSDLVTHNLLPNLNRARR